MPAYKITDVVKNALPGIMTLVEIASIKIIVVKNEEQVYAFRASCPHAGTMLTDGYIDAKNCVVCPTHFYKFDIASGKNVTGEGYRLKTYKTTEADGEWYVYM